MDSSDQPYGPVAPRFAQLDAQERHLYTFTIQPYFYTGFWKASWQRKAPYWQPDFARFIFHLTDKRILVDSYEFSTTEGLAFKGMIGLAKAVGNASDLGYLAGGVEDDEGRMKEMLSKPPEWFALAHTEIASVERQAFNSVLQKLGGKLSGNSLVKIAFKNPAAKALVFVAQAAQARMFAFNKCYSKEFMAAMGRILQGGK